VVALGLLAVCHARHDRPGAQPAPPPAAGLQVLLTTSELVVGENRLAFGLLRDGSLLADARVAVRIYVLEGEDARLVGETIARYDRLEVVEDGKRTHIHPDGTRHVHGDATDVQGIYVARVTFPRAGTWGLEVLVRMGGGAVESARLSVGVLAASPAPMIGARLRVVGTSSPATSPSSSRSIPASPLIRGCIRRVSRTRSRKASRR
jgi:hypothetical protein